MSEPFLQSHGEKADRLRRRISVSAWTAFSIGACLGFAPPAGAIELRTAMTLVNAVQVAAIASAGGSTHGAHLRRSAHGDIASDVGAPVATVRPYYAHKIAPQVVSAAGEDDWPELNRALQARHAEAIDAASSEHQSHAAALEARHAEAIAAARSEYQMNIAALQAEHAETIAAAKTAWRSGVAALQLRRSDAVAKLAGGAQRSDNTAFRAARAQAEDAFGSDWRANDETFEARHAEADTVLQTGWQANHRAFQTAYAEAHEAFQSGWRASHEALQARYSEAAAAMNEGWRANSDAHRNGRV